VSGAEAIAQALGDGGLRAAYSFPGSPATQVALALARDSRLSHAFCTNEAVAATMALTGASLHGWGTACVLKHVGVNVALDALATGAQISEYASPCVIVEGIDAHPRRSQNIQDNRSLWATHARTCALEPGSPQECYDLTRFAIELSAGCHVPVVVRAEERVLLAQGQVERRAAAGPRADAPTWEQPAPLVSTAETCGFHTRKRAWILARIEVPWILAPGLGRRGYLVAGQLGAVAVAGAPTLRLGGCHPLPAGPIRAFAQDLDEVIVVEEGLPLLAESVAALGLHARIGHVPSAEVELVPCPPLRLPPIPELAPRSWVEGFAAARAKMTGFATHDPRLACFEQLRTWSRRPIICTDPGVTGVLGIRDGYVDLKLQMGCAAPAAGAIAESGCERPAVAVMGDTNFYHSELSGVIDNAIARRDVLHVLVDNGKSEMTAGVRTPGLGREALGGLLRSVGLTVHSDLASALSASGPRIVVLRMATTVTAEG
jgi:indolepyruvate ferredoxin oxidoreductase alpha subunit